MAIAKSQFSDGGGIWTSATSQNFYGHVNALAEKLGKKSPRVPRNYRVEGNSMHQPRLEGYLLPYEMELHLADHFAFLAHVDEGVEFVSAATLEQEDKPAGFTVRLASNHTPSEAVVKSMRGIINVVVEHAVKGRHAEEYQAVLFEKVVEFSQVRLHGRMTSRFWIPPRHYGGRKRPLFRMIEERLARSSALSGASAQSLRAELSALVEALKDVETGAAEAQIRLLQEVVRRSYAVSRHGDSQSLETNLRKRGLPETVTQSREVLQIDKISKYLELCHDLIRLGCQPSTRAACMNLTLQPCKAYPGCRPLGSKAECFVHGEVQLILFYERSPRTLPPKAIGSSKSACFLCDLVIQKHGAFGVSSSHMKFQEKWTIPDGAWMNAQQIKRFRAIIKGMDSEIRSLANKKKGFYHLNQIMESRAHILQIDVESSIAASVASPLASEIKLDVRASRLDAVLMSNTPLRDLSPVPSNDVPDLPEPQLDTVAMQNTPLPEPTAGRVTFRSRYYAEDLPVSVNIVSTTLCLKLSIGKVQYIFDCEEIENGELHVSTDDRGVGEKINVRGLPTDSSLCLRPEQEKSTVAFTVHDAGEHELLVAVSWTEA